MKKSKWTALLCVVALIGVAGCSDDDNDPIVPADNVNAATAEAALEGALVEVVDPIFTVIDFLAEGLFAPAPASRGELICPDVSAVCSSGTLSCSEAGLQGLDFVATGCTTLYDGETITLDGDVTVLPGLSTILITFLSFSVNGNTQISGVVALDDNDCSADVDLLADDGTVVDGVIIDCDDNDPDVGSEFTIIVDAPGIGVFVIVFDFDGSGSANASVTSDGEPVASCTVDLDTLDATCTDL